MNENICHNAPRIFLGGTCNKSTWRDEIIPKLDMDYFNPFVDNWTEDDYQNELKEIEKCDVLLFVITPNIKSYYSIAEAVSYSHRKDKECIYMVLPEYDDVTFDEFDLNALEATGMLVDKAGGYHFESKFGDLDDLVFYLNQTYGGCNG